MVNSRQKGKRYELHLVHKLNAYGYETRRGQQFSGANGDADLEGLRFVHIEAKHRERTNIYEWMKQAVTDAQRASDRAKEYIIPTVFHTKNYEEDLVTLRLDDWQMLYDAFLEKRTGKGVSR